MKNDKTSNIVLFLMFFAGLILLLYPSISNYWNSFHSSKAITNYVKAMNDMNEKDYQKIIDDATEYNQKLNNRVNPYKLSYELTLDYERMLDLDGTGVMGYVDIPAVSCFLPIYHGTEERVLQKAVGHLEWTSLPVKGDSTHCVISGHRGLPSAKIFSDLDRLIEGDIFYINVLNEQYKYEIDQILIVDPNDVDHLTIVKGKEYCTLVTCTPYGVNTHRLLIRGERVENKKKAKVISEVIQLKPTIVALWLIIPMLLLLLILLYVPKSSRKVYGGYDYDKYI